MYVCMYVYIYIYIYIRVCVCIYICSSDFVEATSMEHPPQPQILLCSSPPGTFVLTS